MFCTWRVRCHYRWNCWSLVLRAINRTKPDKNSNMELVENMWEQFNNLGRYESNIIDTTHQSIEQSVSTIKAVIEKKSSLLTI